MSRIGKVPVSLPDKVTVKIEGNVVNVKGPKGELTYKSLDLVKVTQDSGVLKVEPADNSRGARAAWGLTRTLIGNMVTGVSTGFTKRLEFTGVGYRAAVAGDVLTLNLGYSHPIDFKLPKGITAVADKNSIDVSGCDKELVGLVCAKIRGFRPPEPYKGKGIKYATETIIRKAGKTSGK